MRIAVEARYLLTKDKTGVENYTYFLLAAMAQALGQDELLLYLQHRPRRDETEMLRPFLASSRCRFRVVPPLRLWLKLWMPLAARLAGAEVALFPGGILPLYTPFPCVTIVHDLAWAINPECYSRRDLHIFKGIYPRTLQAARLVFAVSEFTALDITRVYGTSPAKIRVIPHGRDPKFTPPENAPEVVRAQWGLEPGYILAIGISHPRKNTSALLRAYAISRPERPLVLAGAPGEMQSPLLNLAEELGISDRIRWLGYTPHDKLPALYSAAGLFVMPSLFEGFGMPVLEAMGCGTPVICSNVSSLPEAAGQAALLVDTTRPEAIAQALQRVLSDKELAAGLKEKGLARVQAFDWNRSAALALKYLREIAPR